MLVLHLSLGSEVVPNQPAKIFRSRDFGIWEDRQSFYFCCRLYVGRIRLRIHPHKNELAELVTKYYHDAFVKKWGGKLICKNFVNVY